MADAQLSLNHYLPHYRGGSLGFTNFLIDSTSDKLAFITQIYGNENITKVGFRYGARTGTPPQYKVSIQGLDTNGDPDGTVLGGGSPASATFTPPADTTWDGTWREITLDNAYTPSRGQFMALVIEASGSPDASNNSSFTQNVTQMQPNALRFPNARTDTGGGWTEIGGFPIFSIAGATRYNGNPFVDISSTQMSTIGDRAALKFTLDGSWGDTFKVLGAWMTATSGASGLIKLGLWNAAGTALMETSVDVDVFNTAGPNIMQLLFDDAPVELNYGTAYYLGLEKDTANVLIFHYDGGGVNNNSLAWSGGTNFILSTWNGTSWTDDTDQRPMVNPIFDDITEPAAAAAAPRTWFHGHPA